MSVSFARAVADGMRQHGITVHFADGWQWRGNGQTSAYQGGIVHHTASGYGNALPGAYIFSLLRDGRVDLDGPLCNSAGNEDGSITIVAAHPANHAGAAGGSWARPFPNTRSFNRMVWGHEIVYPGNSPMRPAQYHTAQILGGVISGILRKPNPEWIRAHYETSVTGKWDPGYAPGKWIDMKAFRAGIWGALHSTGPAAGPEPGGLESMALDTTWKDSYGNDQTVEGFMSETQRDLNRVVDALLKNAPSRIPNDKNETNLYNLAFDSGSWSAQTLGHVLGVKNELAALTRAAETLAGLVASQQNLDVDAVKNAVKEAIADVVEGSTNVDIKVGVVDPEGKASS